MSNLGNSIKKYFKVYLIAVILSVIFDSIGTMTLNLSIGTIVIFPMVFTIIIGSLMGPDFLKIFTKEESVFGGTMILIILSPFMAKMGVSAGANLANLVEVGPALLLQKIGNLGTIFLALPVALLLGLGKESIGASYSINRDANLGLTTDIYGPDAPETKGTFGVYIVGSILGPVFLSLFASFVSSWNYFHPLALGMASGVGSGTMMSAATSTLGAIYPEYAEDILILGGASDMLTGIIGIYIGTFIALPLTKKLYSILEPKLSKFSLKNKN